MITTYTGDCRDVLLTLPEKSVQCVVTSPPYYGLRSYLAADDAHKAREIGAEPLHDCLAWARSAPPCGACFVCTLRDVAARLWRVLRDDGVMWLNLGDSYSGGGGFYPDAPSNRNGGSLSSRQDDGAGVKPNTRITALPPKNLLLIPHRVALALQADGWIVRSDLVWAKDNAMPESVTDRPTRAHEYIFLLAKQPRYYYDAAAIAEPAVKGAAGSTFTHGKTGVNGIGCVSALPRNEADTRNARTVWRINTRPFSGSHYAVFPEDIPDRCIRAGSRVGDTVLDPFVGSGTTLRVAERLGRNAIGIDLDTRNEALQEARLNGVQKELAL